MIERAFRYWIEAYLTYSGGKMAIDKSFLKVPNMERVSLQRTQIDSEVEKIHLAERMDSRGTIIKTLDFFMKELQKA